MGIGSRFHDVIVQIAVHFEMDRFATMRARRLDGKRQWLFSQLPLHEGRRNRVYRSSRVRLFAGAKGDVMGRLVHGHGIRPGDRALLVSEQKGHVLLQLVQYADHSGWG